MVLVADSTELTYYWKTIQNNAYQSVRLADLEGRGRLGWAVGPTNSSFAVDVAGRVVDLLALTALHPSLL